MKEKKKKTQKRFQRHFRKFHDGVTTGHPTYVYDDKGNVYKVIGITKSPKTKNVINQELDKNPEPNNLSKAFVRTKPLQVNKGVKNSRLKGWKFTESDKKKVQQIIDKNKK